MPTYNERENIADLISQILRQLRGEFEIIVVDDDSPDGTGEIVARIGAGEPRVRLLRRQGERGLTLALRAGIEAARFDTVIWMDADFAHPPTVLPVLIEQPEAWEIVVASRYVRGGSDGRVSAPRRWISVLLNRLARLTVGSSVRDLSSGFLRVKKHVFSRVPLRGEYGDYCIDFLVRAEKMGFTIREIPYTNIDREKGYSKTTPNPLIFFKYALIYIRTLVRLKLEKPPT